MVDATTRMVALLHQLERHIDGAIAIGGQLSTALVEARVERGLSATVGQPVFREIAQAQVALATARGSTVDMHRALERVGKALGIDVQAYGDGGKVGEWLPALFGADRAAQTVARAD
jgi:hypothetical protein